MRFTATAVAFAGAAAAAGSTILSTDYVTVTSCGPTVTNCPAASTTVSSKVYEVTPSTVYTTKGNDQPPTTAVSKPPVVKGGENPGTTMVPLQPACPTYSVKTISTSVTTVVPTVIYETVSIPCPAPTGPATGTGVPKPPVGGNTTVPVTQPTTPVTAGAASLGASGVLAAAAGLAAVFLA
ncbi:hypothetical protein RB594_000625 [Gaeumannomyces avenae]